MMKPAYPWYKNRTKTVRQLQTKHFSGMQTQISKHSQNKPNSIFFKKITRKDKVECISGMQGCFNIWNSIYVIYHSNRIREKDHNRYRKSIWRNLCIYLIKKKKFSTRLEWNILRLKKQDIYESPTNNIFVSGKILNVFLLVSGKWQRCVPTTPNQPCTGRFSKSIKARSKAKSL